jgi:hypothetical protein
MASIITASASSGLTQSADTSGVLQLASGVGNLVTIPSVTGTAMVSGNMPAFSAYNLGSQTISATTFTKVKIDTKTFDTANCFDATTNYRFTPNVAGYYQIIGNVGNAGAAIRNSPVIYKNGSAYVTGSVNTASYNSNVSSLIYMNGTTDYVELWCYFSASQGTSNSADQTYFNGYLVRTA